MHKRYAQGGYLHADGTETGHAMELQTFSSSLHLHFSSAHEQTLICLNAWMCVCAR